MGRQCILTKYLRVGAKKVVLLELQQMNGDKKISTKTVEKRIIKEIQELLRDVILQRMAMGTVKDKTKGKSATECIFTGTYVQFGYVFKKRYEHQILLISDTSDSEDEDSFHRSFTVHDEKVAVFYCTIDASSPSKMSQLVKVLQNESASQSQQTVSISSYFHRKPMGSSQGSQGHSTGGGSKGKRVDSGVDRSLECEMESCQEAEVVNNAKSEEEVHLPVDDAWSKEKMSKEDKHSVIKNLIKRSGPSLSKKRKRKEKTSPSNNSEKDKKIFIENDTDNICNDMSPEKNSPALLENNQECIYSAESPKVTENENDVEIISDCDSGPESKKKRTSNRSNEENVPHSQEKMSQGKQNGLSQNENIADGLAEQEVNVCKITPCDFMYKGLSSRESSVDVVGEAVVLGMEQVSSFSKSKNLKTYSRNRKLKEERKVKKDFKKVKDMSEGKRPFCSEAVCIISDENSLDKGEDGVHESSIDVKENSKSFHCAEDSILPEISFVTRSRTCNTKSKDNSTLKEGGIPVFSEEDLRVQRKDTSLESTLKSSAVICDEDMPEVMEGEGSPKFIRPRPSGKQDFMNQVSSCEESDAEIVFRSRKNRKRMQQILSSASIDESDDVDEDPIPVSKVRRNHLHHILSSTSFDDREASNRLNTEENSNDKENKEMTSKISCISGGTNETSSLSTNIDNEDPLPKLRCLSSKEKKNSKKVVVGNLNTLVKGIFEKKANGQKTLDALFSNPSKCSKDQKETLDFDDDLDCAEMEDSILETGLADSLWKEIRSFQSVDQLNQQHLQFLVDYHKHYLQDVFRGKVLSDRHLSYKMGGKQRKDLNYQVHLGLFTDEQQDVVMDTLLKIFCKKRHKYLDYTMKVLLPEMLIRIYMEVQGVSYEEAENQMQDAVKVDGAIYH